MGVVIVVVEGCDPGFEDVDDLDNNMQAAAEVVEAMADAETGSGWLCVPSYVVIKMDMSSAHLCTYILLSTCMVKIIQLEQ